MEGIDDYYVWQRRIYHGIRCQKVSLPFPESVKIGLEFNAALEREEKLDQHLLTNAVMLEICEFAKTVTRSEKYFLFEILEFNFDLGVDADNDMQSYEYATRVHNKIKQLKDATKLRPHKWAETFPLPDPDIIKASTESEVPKRYYPKRNKITDISLLTDGSKNRQSPENQKRASDRVTSSAFILKRKGGFRLKRTGEGYPFCKKTGVNLAVRPHEPPKHKLAPNLVTIGLMMELLDFSRALCGTHKQMVNDIVKQNFGLELDKIMFHIQLNKLIEKKNACLTPEDKDTFRKEMFQVQYKKREQKYKKRKNPDTDFNDLEKLTVASKRRETLRHRDSDAQEIWQDSDLSYMCPVDFETEMQSGAEAETEKNDLESLSGTAVETKLSVSLDAQKEEEKEAFRFPAQPQTISNNYHLKDRSPKTKGGLFSEDKIGDKKVKTAKQKLWMRRAARCKQLLRLSRVNDLFAHCREIGLDFNVGSGNKQNLDLQLLTNWVLLEVFKFATAMTKSLRSFLFDILGNNFHLSFHDDTHLRNFIYYIITKEKVLQTHPDRKKAKFLSSPFQFPKVYNIVDVTSYSQTELELEQKQQENWDLSGSGTSHQKQVKRHPYCRKLGVNLWSSKELPENKKLDLTALTTGAVLEIFSFTRELCGSVREIVNDVLEHNFDVHLQGRTSEAARVMKKWYVTQKSLMKKQSMSPKINRWLNMVVPLNSQSQFKTHSGPVDLDTEDVKLDTTKEALTLNTPQYTEISRYHICKKIGLDLEIDSKSQTKTKLDLEVLTRGVLFEVHQYVEQNCNRYVPALYEILEYNFDLSSQSHRKVEFAWSIASQVIAMVGKNGRKEGYLSKVFELPMEFSECPQIVCKEEQEDSFDEPDFSDEDDIVFVRKLQPVDLEVELE
ncbi:hypothetical protein EXN66_Car021130 [Channa argus]|uniref:Uncharacterized protein n=1 Tax=Channa argus TaxID=215402 RepID=A0A6G1QSZ3_CHAAH|nr:hypothetical protein EXN66_Car021130 [Channa argus]KAK2882325.1 hypothetical protein Q8A73_022835 [Channa argus]